MEGKRKIVMTGDGSTTFLDGLTGDLYHSRRGAETESRYVYIDKGLEFIASIVKEINVLEVGMGTGLNLLLTAEYLLEHQDVHVHYTTLEPYPLSDHDIGQLKFSCLSDHRLQEVFRILHSSEWGQKVQLMDNLTFTKLKLAFQDLGLNQTFDLVYFDAFGPEYQADMWTEAVVDKLYSVMNDGSILVTYSSQGDFKRALRSSGFHVQRLKGPPGKWHMIRAEKQVRI